jgi:hypothetical protein
MGHQPFQALSMNPVVSPEKSIPTVSHFRNNRHGEKGLDRVLNLDGKKCPWFIMFSLL